MMKSDDDKWLWKVMMKSKDEKKVKKSNDWKWWWKVMVKKDNEEWVKQVVMKTDDENC